MGEPASVQPTNGAPRPWCWNCWAGRPAPESESCCRDSGRAIGQGSRKSREIDKPPAAPVLPDPPPPPLHFLGGHGGLDLVHVADPQIVRRAVLAVGAYDGDGHMGIGLPESTEVGGRLPGFPGSPARGPRAAPVGVAAFRTEAGE